MLAGLGSRVNTFLRLLFALAVGGWDPTFALDNEADELRADAVLGGKLRSGTFLRSWVSRPWATCWTAPVLLADFNDLSVGQFHHGGILLFTLTRF
jgi:hypothetical protein